MFRISFYKPAPGLQRYVQFYTQREVSLRDPLFVHPVPARAAPMIEFIFGERFKVLYAGSSVEETTPGAVVVGMQTRPNAQLRLQGVFQSFVIMFQPSGLEDLFPVALKPTDKAIFKDGERVAGPSRTWSILICGSRSGIRDPLKTNSRGKLLAYFAKGQK